MSSQKFSEEEGVSNLSTNEALDLVKSTVDKDVLESWAKSEKRKPVLSAIEKQLAELNKPIERRSDSSKK